MRAACKRFAGGVRGACVGCGRAAYGGGVSPIYGRFARYRANGGVLSGGPKRRAAHGWAPAGVLRWGGPMV